jgi:hypothetical protein
MEMEFPFVQLDDVPLVGAEVGSVEVALATS